MAADPTVVRCTAALACEGGASLSVALDGPVSCALQLLREGKDEASRLQAVALLRSCIPVLCSPAADEWTGVPVGSHAPHASDSWYLQFSLEEPPGSARAALVAVASGLMLAVADKSLKAAAEDTLSALVRRCTLLACIECDVDKRANTVSDMYWFA